MHICSILLSDKRRIHMHLNDKGQMCAPATVKMTAKDFEAHEYTSVYWLGGGGAMINSRGTVIMIDPLLEGFDMPMLVDYAMNKEDVPHVDGIVISHVDNDHYSRPTCRGLKDVCDGFHSTGYVSELMPQECGVECTCHDIGEHFMIKDVDVELTPADHCWQKEFPKYAFRTWSEKEYCGFYFRTADGKKIWYVGDSRLMEEQLHMEQPDVIFFDFADNVFHIGLNNAYKLANTYPEAKLVLIHWGTVDAPEQSPFNGNPENIKANVVNPERVVVLAPGQEYIVD